MRAPSPPTLTLPLALLLVACGTEVNFPAETAVPDDPAGQAAGNVELLRGSEVGAVSRRSLVDSSVLFEHRRLLAPVLPRMYFIGWPSEAPRPDAVTLRVTGAEPVSIRSVTIRDDILSAFGDGAGAYFSYRVIPDTATVDPETPVDIEVTFSAGLDSTIQNAVLEIVTDAENTPVLLIGLTGKMALY